MMRLYFLLMMMCLSACALPPREVYREARAVPQDAHTPPIRFSTLQIRIPRGEDIGTLSHKDSGCLFSMPVGADLLRGELAGETTKNEIREAFENALEPLGYDVVRSASNYMFEEEADDELLRTEYKVGAKLVALEMDVCGQDAEFSLFGVNPAGVSGEMLATFEWSVFDNVRKTSAYKDVRTKGYAKRLDVNREGVALMLLEAFEMAAHNLGADRTFYDLMVRGVRPEKTWRPKNKDFEQRPRLFDPTETVQVNSAVLSKTPLTEDMSRAQKSAVLVQGGLGHGSGFFISQTGHILTNEHVVGNARRVRIVTSGGKEKLAAEVLRTDKTRDIALLRLEELPEGLEIVTLPMRLDWPAVGEEVYVVGAPQKTRLQDTVTRGIISAHRPNYRIFGVKLDLLQADVSVHGGNSGGPMLDRFGNIVGVTVAGIDPTGTGSNASLNYFIPIWGALTALDIENL